MAVSLKDKSFINGATTLDFTIEPEESPSNEGLLRPYFKLKYAKPDKIILRKDAICETDFARRVKKKCKKINKRTPIATFVQVTDNHIIDATSPARNAFLSLFVREVPVLAEAFRPYEAFTTQVQEVMIKKINCVEKGPVLNQKIGLVINTGDNGDGEQINELINYINLLDGGKVIPNPATPGRYVGVQDDYPANLYEAYYHPDPPPEGKSNDIYKVDYGYPEFPNILNVACRPFKATGLSVPWLTCNGNHDSTKFGAYSLGFSGMLTLFDQLSTGNLPDGLGSKLIESVTPLQAKNFIKALILQDPNAVLNIIKKANLREIPNSDKRRQFTRADFIRAHFNTTLCPGPVGHGFNEDNINNDTVYYTFKISDKITGIMLDSCNPSGNLIDPNKTANGSFGRIQMDWFEKELRKRHSFYYNDMNQLICTKNKDELIMIFCHHNIEALDNNFNSPTTFDNDPQRILGIEFVKILHRYPNIIGFINGHEHRNRITFYPDPLEKTQGFWQINTASHIDYPQQSRIFEISENDNDTISIFCTMIDHQSVPNAHRGCFPTGPGENCSRENCDTDSHCNTNSCCQPSKKCKEDYTIEEIASISRELSYNDPFLVDLFDEAENRTGTPKDRNVELVIFNPLKFCK